RCFMARFLQILWLSIKSDSYFKSAVSNYEWVALNNLHKSYQYTSIGLYQCLRVNKNVEE
ncbi:MAG: hypothetical protein AAFX46_04625, partial [Cyanobacteria bacterium J06636_27]